MSLIKSEDFLGTNRFLIQNLIGSGTFGVVYQVYDQINNSVVALKKLRKVLYEQNSEALYRFKQEFRALAEVNHPNLVDLYELISDGNQWFFTMELIDGVSFIDYVYGKNKHSNLSNNSSQQTILDAATTTINKSTVSKNIPKIHQVSSTNTTNSPRKIAITPGVIDRLREALKQLAAGIHALHKIGKLHRDLKPSNVLVTDSGRVVILDFGLVIEQTLENLEIDLVGTPTHMSPEQAAGLPITTASDWYSFGVILYQALTGQLPFSGKLFEILNKKQFLDPVSPNQIVESLPTDLADLCLALLQRDPQNRPTGLEIIESFKDKNSSTLTKRFSPATNVFVGRNSHISSLTAAFNHSKSAGPAIAYVYGISGMGKTSLARYFLAQTKSLNSNVLILSGRCYEQESMPYKVFDSLIDSLAQYLKFLSESLLLELLPDDFLALTRLFPVLKSIPTIRQEYKKVLKIPDTQELRRRAFTALRQLLINLSQKYSVVLFIDDLQWGDGDSIALVQEVFRPPDPPSILLIATYRSEEKHNVFLKALLALPKESTVNSWHIEVDKLSEEESRELALKLLGENEEILSVFADLIAEESAGIPFFIVELVQHIPIGSANKRVTKTGELISSGKLRLTKENTEAVKSLEAVIHERILHLPTSAQHLLEVIAIAGRPILRQLAKQVAGLQQEELSAISLLRSQHLIRFRENFNDELEIYHDRIREAIIRYLTTSEKQLYHHKLALALEAFTSIDPEILVVHFLQSSDLEKTAKYALIAGDKARQALAFEQAAHFYQICINLYNKDTAVESLKTLQVKLATVLSCVGRGAEAAQVFLLASEEAEVEEWLDLQRRAAEQFLVSGLITEGLSLFNTILNALGMQLPTTPQEAFSSMLATRTEISTRGFNFSKRAESELSTEEKLSIDACWSIVIGLTFIDTIRAAEFQARHLLLALESGEIYRISRALAMEVGHRAAGGKAVLNNVFEIVEYLDKLLTKSPNIHTLGLYKLVIGSISYFNGKWKETCQFMREAEKIFREQCANVPWEIDATKLYLLRALYYLGEIKEIAYQLPSLLKEVQERSNLWVVALIYSRFYIVPLADDLPNIAEKQVKEAINNWSQESFYMQHYWSLFANIEIALYNQQAVKAWEMVDKSWSKLTESLLLRVEVFLLETFYLHARCALAIALESDEKDKFFVLAKQDAQEIENRQVAWAMPLAQLIYAMISVQTADKATAILQLEQAETKLIAVDMYLYAYCACYRRGQLMGDNKGENLKQKASEWLNNQTIKNVASIADMLIPGHWE